MKIPELQQYSISQHYTERQSFLLSKMGIFTIEDLIGNFPFRYEDRTKITSLAEAILLQQCALVKVTVSSHHHFFWNKKRCAKIIVHDQTASAELTSFNIPSLERLMPIGQEFYVYAKFDFKFNKVQSSNFEFEDPSKFGTEASSLGRIVPIYRLTEGLRLKEFHKILHKAFQKFYGHIIDPIPKYFLENRNLMGKIEAIETLHNPKTLDDIEKARIRGAYEEFMSTRVALEKKRLQETTVLKEHRYLDTNLETLTKVLPFEMTNAQKRVISEMIEDLSKSHSMHRLVQGDVGSGKTTVALAAMVLAAQNGLQAALLAPTEVLAFQHYKKIVSIMDQLQIPCGLLTGSISTKERKPILEGLKNGSLPIIIGTHALFQKEVEYHNLSLVVIDEQHKFGVEQRSALIKKGEQPDILVMTATPIPRSITLALYGDLSLSIIDELPAGRQEIQTSLVTQKNYEQMLQQVNKEIKEGRQVFVVCPLIEENEQLQNTKSVEQIYSEYQKYFPQYCLSLIHGKMSQQEKDSIMKDFSENKSQILIATTVIEVGIDIPNATIMIIENAERFGLAQLHQLRGRVGRSSFKSYCYAVNYGYNSDQRLDIFCSTRDGFKIAEEDLKIRGPGELLGTRQTGIPIFKLADFSRDQKILSTAIRDAQLIMNKDPQLEHHELLKKFLIMDNEFLVFSG